MYTARMSDEDREAAERAEKRRNWPVRIYDLDHEPDENLAATTTPEERLAMMWPLALEAWSLIGQPIPEYSRSEMPIRVVDLLEE